MESGKWEVALRSEGCGEKVLRWDAGEKGSDLKRPCLKRMARGRILCCCCESCCTGRGIIPETTQFMVLGPLQGPIPICCQNGRKIFVTS